jgi:hypothetical protein
MCADLENVVKKAKEEFDSSKNLMAFKSPKVSQIHMVGLNWVMPPVTLFVGARKKNIALVSSLFLVMIHDSFILVSSHTSTRSQITLGVCLCLASLT